MELNSGATTFAPEEVDIIKKSSESTQSSETTVISETSGDSFDEYKEMVDNFNEMMDPDSEQQHHAGAHSDIHTSSTDDENMNSMEVRSSLPSGIARYAAEIWYPECRDCGCCQGFKHGCNCAASNKRICMCVTGIPDDTSIVTMNSNELWCQQLQSKSHSIEFQLHPTERRCSRRGVKVVSPCRFFFSAAGCRHSDACSFSHTKEE